jgi:hypothetical protein
MVTRMKRTRMKRTTVFLLAEHETALNKEAKQLGVSVAEVVRRLIDEGILQRDYEAKHSYPFPIKIERTTERRKRMGLEDSLSRGTGTGLDLGGI